MEPRGDLARLEVIANSGLERSESSRPKVAMKDLRRVLNLQVFNLYQSN